MRHARGKASTRRPALFRRPGRRTVLALAAGVTILTVTPAFMFVRPDRMIRDDDTPASAASPLAVGPTSTGPSATGPSATGPSATGPTATASTPVTAPTSTARFGVFLGSDPDAVADFENWIGRPVQDVVDFSPRDNWDHIANPTELLAGWKGTGYRLIYAVPMLPNEENATKEASMKAGARGEYDDYFATLARNLVKAGQEDAVLRIGWEFNLKSWPWGIDDAPTFVKYFQHIVTAMRAVDGAKFTINWNVNNGFNPNDGVEYYPGDAYVDTVGVDAYDVDGTVYPYPADCDAVCREGLQARAWDEVIYGGPRGLEFWLYFAVEHKKKLSLPEWGLWERPDRTGGGDNPYFVQQMHDFIASSGDDIAFAAYFDLNSDTGRHNVQKSFPVAGARFRELFAR